MQAAISSGAPEEVTALLAILESMNKASITRELTGCYGGRRGNPARADERGLFRMTVPLLHAAFTGSTRMFYTVLASVRAKLRAPQVRLWFIVAKRAGKKARHGDASVMNAKDYDFHLCKARVVSTCRLFVVDPGGAAEAMCNASLTTFFQVKRTLTSRDGHSRTVLIMALASKSEVLFKAALAAVEEDLTRDEVCL